MIHQQKKSVSNDDDPQNYLQTLEFLLLLYKRVVSKIKRFSHSEEIAWTFRFQFELNQLTNVHQNQLYSSHYVIQAGFFFYFFYFSDLRNTM